MADEPTLANGPHSTRGEITCIPLQKSWQMNLHWLMDAPVPEKRWLAYHYTKPGRWTYFGQWTPSTRGEITCIPLHKTQQMNLHWPMDPQYQRRDDLHTTTENLADEPTLADGCLSTREEMTCIPLHKTLQMNLLWPVDPLVLEQRWLAYHYTKLSRWTYIGWWTPQYQSRDALNTTTQNLGDEPPLANGPPSTRAEMNCIPQHKIWQMNLLWLNTMVKVWKL